MAASRSTIWTLALLGVFIAYALATLVYLQPSPASPHVPGPAPKALLAIADGTQFLASALVALLAIRRGIRSAGRTQVFWFLMSAGFATWAFSQGAWVWSEVFLGQAVPDPYWADVVLFFHFVPLTAALIVRPHRPGEVRKIVLPAIDWSMLFVWWLFLYVYLVFPWQFIHLNVTSYDRAFNDLYMAENFFWLGALAFLYLTVRTSWRRIYGMLFLCGGIYSLSSKIIDQAIRDGRYYSGSLYDLPLIAALLGFVWVFANAESPEREVPSSVHPDSHEEEAIGPRLAMAALLSIPVIVTWTEYGTTVHGDIYRFRLLASMISMLAMGALVFVKQYLLDLERIRLLHESRTNFSNLQQLQAQIVQNEKLASLGQLVSGAAHEINNPLTAILGYAELMEYDARSDETLKSHASKIKQQVLRTKDLVKNLLRFARQSGGEKKLVNLNLIVENSVRARELEATHASIDFVRELSPKVPPVLGDEAQLTDVCMQLLGNAAGILSQAGGGKIGVKTYVDAGWVVLEVHDSGPGMADPARVFDPFFTTKTLGQGTGLGLSICYGIIADHKGFIFAENIPEGGARLVVRLPIPAQIPASSAIARAGNQQ